MHALTAMATIVSTRSRHSHSRSSHVCVSEGLALSQRESAREACPLTWSLAKPRSSSPSRKIPTANVVSFLS